MNTLTTLGIHMSKTKLLKKVLLSNTARTALTVALIAPTPILVGLTAAGYLTIAPKVEQERTEVIEPMEVVQYRDLHVAGQDVKTHNLDCAAQRKDELICLTCNIYEESRNQPFAGQVLVAKTTLNRAKASGDSICHTVWKHKQFSWTNFPLGRKPVKEMEPWRHALEVAHLVLMEAGKARKDDVSVVVMAGGQASSDVKWYHTQEVSPKWKADLTQATVIGDHIFYKKG
jgi:spore germination cell wall hydrolase CwlJ-like protein